MEKQEVISVIKEIVKMFRKNVTLDFYYIDKVIFCGEDIIVGVDIKDHNDGDIFLLTNPSDCVGEWAKCYNLGQLMRFCGRLIAYVNGEPSVQSDEHYEQLTLDWFNRHKQYVYIVALIDTTNMYAPISKRLFRSEVDANDYYNSLISDWKSENKGCKYKECYCDNIYGYGNFYGYGKNFNIHIMIDEVKIN